jgi:hypothetical protein
MKAQTADGIASSVQRNSPVKIQRLTSFMFYLVTVLLTLQLVLSPAMAADPSPVVGVWEGTLDPGAQPKKRIVIHISAAQDGGLNGTIDYPDENSSGMMITAITYKAPVLHFESSAALAVYDGSLSQDSLQIIGTWKQGGKALDLVLKRVS